MARCQGSAETTRTMDDGRWVGDGRCGCGAGGRHIEYTTEALKLRRAPTASTALQTLLILPMPSRLSLLL
eukprot:scaffold50070_cov112-Isochrysis_galbana.AAC.5